MTHGIENMQDNKKDAMEHKTSWRLMSSEEKEDIKKNAEEKRKELQRKENIKKADIMTGKQKTVDAWGE